MIGADVFIPFVIIAVTQMLKQWVPGIYGKLTVLIAFAVGIIVALVDGFIGVTDISIAQGILYALIAIGITTTASKAGGGARGDVTK